MPTTYSCPGSLRQPAFFPPRARCRPLLTGGRGLLPPAVLRLARRGALNVPGDVRDSIRRRARHRSMTSFDVDIRVSAHEAL